MTSGLGTSTGAVTERIVSDGKVPLRARIVPAMSALAARVGSMPPRVWICAGLVLAIGLALWTTFDHIPVQPGEVEHQMSVRGDVYHIYTCAAKSSWRDIPRWFAGS